ncbi:MAG: molybdate ABC transporter substrate-binding protein [Paracoccaceae bacterium]|nr:molybdate ABC transporter substrate-binding protein [Paracoccaceae bacterium]
MKWLWLSFWFFLAGTAAQGADRLVVFAAASLKGPLDVVLADFEGDVVVSYASSAVLARQIQQGAPADLFLSANTAWAQLVAESKGVSSVPFLGNRLVLISATETPIELTVASLESRLAGGRLALGLTRSVPAGLYAREAFETLDLWSSLRPHLAETDNVRAVLALVARGEAPLGVVYVTDAEWGAVHVVADIPTSSHAPIIYPIVNTGQGDALAMHLRRRASVFADAGFSVIEPAQ